MSQNPRMSTRGTSASTTGRAKKAANSAFKVTGSVKKSTPEKQRGISTRRTDIDGTPVPVPAFVDPEVQIPQLQDPVQDPDSTASVTSDNQAVDDDDELDEALHDALELSSDETAAAGATTASPLVDRGGIVGHIDPSKQLFVSPSASSSSHQVDPGLAARNQDNLRPTGPHSTQRRPTGPPHRPQQPAVRKPAPVRTAWILFLRGRETALFGVAARLGRSGRSTVTR